jgi:hypothetical protein
MAWRQGTGKASRLEKSLGAIEQLTGFLTLKHDRRIVPAPGCSENLLQSRPTVTAWLVDAGDGPDTCAALGPSDPLPIRLPRRRDLSAKRCILTL